MNFQHDASLLFPTMKQQNLPFGRVYAVEAGPHAGKFYPSITRILGAIPKPQLEAWKKKLGTQEAGLQTARAAARGASLHSISECYLGNDVLPKYSPMVGELWSRLKPILDKNIGLVYAQEQNIYSDKLGAAGRFDLLAQWNGLPSIIDFKNSKKRKNEQWESVQSYFDQETFYALAVYECTGLPVRQLVLPIVSPEGIDVYISQPSKHYQSLLKKIDYFYTNCATELDIQAKL